MNTRRLLLSVTALLLFQLVGEAAVQALSLPIPGPVAGMFLLYAALTARGAAPRALTRAANGLLSQLSLLFIPAGVGIMAHLALLRREWPAIVAALLVGTALTLLATAFSMRWLMARAAAAEPEGGR